jgi:membrane protein
VRPQRLAGFRDAIGQLLERRVPRRIRLVVSAYGRIGGGILADGLAYNALFALLPALLLVVAVVGFIVHDPARQAQIVDAIAAQLPPLRDLLTRTLAAMATGATEVSIVGLLTLIWGASRFARALDTSFGRVFNRTPERGILRRSIVGVASVIVLIAAVVIALALASVASIVAADLGNPVPNLDLGRIGLLNPLLTAIAAGSGVAAVYRYMPARHPAWRAVRLPAFVVGVAVAIFTQVFAFVAPRLIGIAVLYGAIAAVFAVLAWLSIVAQLLLIGLVWVRFREEGWPRSELSRDD